MSQHRRVSAQKQWEIDVAIKDRHRLWGFDVPAADIDWLVTEYCYRKAKALNEYKHAEAKRENTLGANLDSMVDLARSARKHAYMTRWQSEPHWAFEVHSLQPGDRRVRRMSERQYVEFMYQIRGVTRLAPQVLDRCDDHPPTFAEWESVNTTGIRSLVTPANICPNCNGWGRVS